MLFPLRFAPGDLIPLVEDPAAFWEGLSPFLKVLDRVGQQALH